MTLKNVLNKFAANEKVTQDMLMGDILRQHPEVADTLIAQGMHCLVCPSSQAESLENACRVHGLDPQQVAMAVNVAIQAGKQ